ncbi:MAG: UdgX family uracil-DNA binding protein [Dongiaceae bacterium]
MQTARQRSVTARRRKAEPEGSISLSALRTEAAVCRACPLWRNATRTVFGEGPASARLMFVGEQPGSAEDLAGRPFVGPAGQVFDKALAEARIDRQRQFVTNAVKHFKFERRGKKRIHQRPTADEIAVCRWWLAHEIATVQPRLIVALGASAARAIVGKTVRIGETRGQILTAEASLGGVPILVTVHPSYLLRIPDAAQRRVEFGRFVADLQAAKRHATGASGSGAH